MSVEFSYIEAIYEKLGGMDILLDANPLEYGPGRINQKIAQVRAFLSSTENIFLEVSHNLAKFKRDLLRSETELDILKINLMATDPHVRSGRSQAEREALASTVLISELENINDLKLSVHDLDDVMRVIKAKRADLKDLQGRLRDQLKLCQEMINLGQRWGSKIDIHCQGDTVIEADSSLREDSFIDDLLNKNTDDNFSNLVQSDDDLEVESQKVKDFLNKELEEKTEPVDVDLDSLFDDWGV